MNKINWSKLDSAVCIQNTDDNYIFNNQLQKICKLSKEFINSQNKTESIIGIIGDRGSGKSSLLRTVENKLKDDYFSLGVLDPSTFDESMSIIELFINCIFQYLIKKNLEDQPSGLKENLLAKLKKITKILADYNAGTQSFYRDYAYTEILYNLETRVNMTKLINELVKNFIDYVNYTDNSKHSKIAIYIDDVDIVSNSKVYKLLEDIRKYLAGNMLVVIAYRNEQLFESVLHEKIIENKVLLDNKLLTVEQLKEQVSRYIEKLIPVHNRVEVMNTENLLEVRLDRLLYDLAEEKGKIDIPDGSLHIKDWIYKNLERKLRLKLVAVDNSENTVYNLPTNLRGILQLVRLIIEDLRVLDFNVQSSHVSLALYTDDLLYNLNTYMKYFVNNLSGSLPTKIYNIIATWQSRDYKAKNYYTCSAVIDLMSSYPIRSKFQDEYRSVSKLTSYQIYNVTLGDVHRVLDLYKNGDSSLEGHYFVYAMKVLYSAELLTQYLSALKSKFKSNNVSEYEQYLSNYLVLINARIIFEGFTYINDGEKAMVIKYTGDNVNLKKEHTNPLYKYLMYTNIAFAGDIRRAIDTQKFVNSPFYYRPIVNYDLFPNNSALIIDTKYPIDPFSFVGQKWYIEETINTCIDNISYNKYVFYSMFDIDIFMRLNYGRTDANPPKTLERILRKINLVVSRRNYKRNYFEHDLLDNISNGIFNNYVDNDFSGADIFSAEILSDLDKLNFALNATDKDFKELKKPQAIEILNKLLQSNLNKSDKETVWGYLNTLSQLRRQVSNEMKKFIKDMVNKYDIELNAEDTDE